MYPHHPILYKDAGIISPERAKLHLLEKKKKKKKQKKKKKKKKKQKKRNCQKKKMRKKAIKNKANEKKTKGKKTKKRKQNKTKTTKNGCQYGDLLTVLTGFALVIDAELSRPLSMDGTQSRRLTEQYI